MNLHFKYEVSSFNGLAVNEVYPCDEQSGASDNKNQTKDRSTPDQLRIFYAVGKYRNGIKTLNSASDLIRIKSSGAEA